MDKQKVAELINGNKYFSINDLRYNQEVGLMFSKDEFEDFLKTKDELIEEGYKLMMRLPLKTFNSKYFFYVNSVYLLEMQIEYRRILLSDYELNQSLLFDRNLEDILTSRLYSEIEGSLSIENIPTTQRHIAQIRKVGKPTDKNDIIIKNMINAVEFIVTEKPDFNKDNLLKLYNILSENCLSDDQTLKAGNYYRDDKVYIGAFEGADWQIINECMDSLFSFANDPKNIKEHYDLLPYICHYYILYIHPYFDYNGRTARMVSFWLSYIHKIVTAPYFMSEAINESKNDYYRAIVETRNTKNDVTYFLGYILETSITYSFVYKNLEEMKKTLNKTGDTLTSSEWVYVKKILVHSPENYFNHKMFLTYINTKMSRQGVLKILNNLSAVGILKKNKNKKGDTIFKLNKEFVKYKYHK